MFFYNWFTLDVPKKPEAVLDLLNASISSQDGPFNGKISDRKFSFIIRRFEKTRSFSPVIKGTVLDWSDGSKIKVTVRIDSFDLGYLSVVTLIVYYLSDIGRRSHHMLFYYAFLLMPVIWLFKLVLHNIFASGVKKRLKSIIDK